MWRRGLMTSVRNVHVLYVQSYKAVNWYVPEEFYSPLARAEELIGLNCLQQHRLMRSLYGFLFTFEHSFAFIFKLITPLITIYTVLLMYGHKRIKRKTRQQENRDLGLEFMLMELLKLLPWGNCTENEIKLKNSRFLCHCIVVLKSKKQLTYVKAESKHKYDCLELCSKHNMTDELTRISSIYSNFWQTSLPEYKWVLKTHLIALASLLLSWVLT